MGSLGDRIDIEVWVDRKDLNPSAETETDDAHILSADRLPQTSLQSIPGCGVSGTSNASKASGK